ncbi:ScyD/ScyE family protein [Conyzicola sp.]|uniref:ScyD/ScyE family protein n=1 Tax=Conyzicola sp. TaxID=1969404 RepID=UPI003989BA69
MTIKRTRAFAAIVAALVVPTLLATSPAMAAPTGGSPGHHPPVPVAEAHLIASGLQGATGSAIGPDRALYVTEGAIGQITRVDPRTGETSVYASGLPASVIGIGGAIDIDFVGRTAYVLVTVVGDDAPGPNGPGTSVDGIYRVDGPTSFTVVADIGAWSLANPPETDFFLSRGLQFALQATRSGFLVTDGHHNRVLKVSRSGEISELATFGNTVPTGLAVDGRTVYMAEAGPVPHLPETGRILAFSARNPEPRVIASGYSLMIDVEFGKCDVLYGLSQGDSPGVVPDGSPALADSGELLRVNRNGTMTPVVSELDLPTSLEFIRDTAFVVTLNGEIWRVDDVSGGPWRHGCRDGGRHSDDL